jgi:Asp-tRNA(Asn)/Glu-tRNA(Gln) amidotransferase A subunit family amidase
MITSAARRAAASELWCLSATELPQTIRSRQVSSREVIEAHLRRIEAVNPRSRTGSASSTPIDPRMGGGMNR